jgi:hypothetical protein
MWQLGILGGRDASCYGGCSSDVLVRKGAPDFGGKEKADGSQIRKRRHQMGRQMHVVVPRYLLRLRHRCGSSRHRGRYDFVADIIRTWHDPCRCCCNERLCGSFHQQLHQVRLQHRPTCAQVTFFLQLAISRARTSFSIVRHRVRCSLFCHQRCHLWCAQFQCTVAAVQDSLAHLSVTPLCLTTSKSTRRRTLSPTFSFELFDTSSSYVIVALLTGILTLSVCLLAYNGISSLVCSSRRFARLSLTALAVGEKHREWRGAGLHAAVPSWDS